MGRGQAWRSCRAKVRVRKRVTDKGAAPRRRVLLVDRHALMRRAAEGWINGCASLEVCGMAGSMAEAFRAVRSMHPDVVVTEIMRPHDVGFIQQLHREHPHLLILVFTIQEEALFRRRAEEAGADGYLMKGAGGEALLREVRATLDAQGRANPRRQVRRRAAAAPSGLNGEEAV